MSDWQESAGRIGARRRQPGIIPRPMAHTFETERRVEFAETDMAGIVHFANFFRWMETAEHDFFRSLGLSLHSHGTDGMRGFARGHAECTYERPLAYQDVVAIRLVVRAKTRSSLAYDFTFSKGGEVCARGAMKVVCVARADGAGGAGNGGRRMRAVPIPADIAAAIEVAPTESRETAQGG